MVEYTREQNSHGGQKTAAERKHAKEKLTMLVASLAKDGVSQRKIAEQLGLSHQQVRTILSYCKDKIIKKRTSAQNLGKVKANLSSEAWESLGICIDMPGYFFNREATLSRAVKKYIKDNYEMLQRTLVAHEIVLDEALQMAAQFPQKDFTDKMVKRVVRQQIWGSKELGPNHALRGNSYDSFPSRSKK